MEDETMDDVKALAQEFINYYTGWERHPDGGCGNCGGLPHSTTCFVGRFERALAAPRPSEAEQAHGYLSRLLLDFAPQCEPLPDLMGLCTQIDNLLAGMVERPAPSIMCPLCGEEVRQVASATLGLALSQHVNWACPRGRLAEPVDVQAIAAVAWECIKSCKDYEMPPVMCPVHQEQAKRIAARPSGEREAPASLVALVMEYQNRRTAYNQNRDDLSFQRVQEALDAIIAWRPSPPGERPEIEVGDWVMSRSGMFAVGNRDDAGWWSTTLSDGILEIRKPNGVVWRKP